MNDKNQQLYQKARKLIPGGTQLLTKRPEMFLPDIWPAYYSRAKGIEVWDLDDRRYLDMCYMGVGACVLGYADEDVDAAVTAAIKAGSMNTLNCPEEVELAELLIKIHPWAEMVRYARGGGEAMAIAVRIARAFTGRDKVAFCGYHGWHDWYLAANLGGQDALDGHLISGLEPRGVPRSYSGTALAFRYNEIDELKEIVAKNRGEIGAIVMEPMRNYTPVSGFLEEVRDIADAAKAVLIFDEVSAGFRLNTGGSHLLYKVTPDIAVFAKAMSNGYPMAAVIGTSDIMQAAQDTFISSTYWTEKIGPAAALATIKKHGQNDVARHLVYIGRHILDAWEAAADLYSLNITITGIPPLGHFTFNYPNSDAIRTLFTQEMLKRGFLATDAFYASYAHREEHVKVYSQAMNEVFALISIAIARGEVEKLLKGPVAQSGFQRLT